MLVLEDILAVVVLGMPVEPADTAELERNRVVCLTLYLRLWVLKKFKFTLAVTPEIVYNLQCTVYDPYFTFCILRFTPYTL